MRTLIFSGIASILVLVANSGLGVTAPAAKDAPTQVAWKDMKGPERGKYMKEVVVPKMKVIFQEHDPELFAKFNCSTCHGKDPKKKKFKMPSPDLEPLPGTPEAFQAKVKEKASWPKFTKFMAEKVTPQMAALLGTNAFDHKKPEAGGFSCNGCHTLIKP
jgi:hypothetical protein